MAKNATQAAEAATQAAATDAPEKTETKGEAFIRIAKRRMGNALSAIKLLEGLSNKANYDYTDAHAAAMLAALRNQVTELEKMFAAGGKKEAAVGFDFEGGATTIEGGNSDDTVEGEEGDDEPDADEGEGE